MQEKDFELLTSMYQNCQTAILSIQDIEPQVESEELRAELREEKERYQDFLFTCKEIAEKENQELPDNSMFEKARLWTSIKMTTIFDNSTRHLAEMLLNDFLERVEFRRQLAALRAGRVVVVARDRRLVFAAVIGSVRKAEVCAAVEHEQVHRAVRRQYLVERGGGVLG